MPSDWPTRSLEECMAAIIDYRGKSPEKTSFGIPLVTAKIIKSGRIEKPEEFIAQADYEMWMRRGIPQKGDVVMTTEAPLGEVAQLDDTKIALAQRVITLRGKADVLNNTFLKFLLQWEPIQEQLRARSTGTTVLGIRQSELRKISLPIPPLKEQQAIAAVLGALDDKIELNRRMNATLETMARTLFQSWFVDFDPVRRSMDKKNGSNSSSVLSTVASELDPLFPNEFQDSELGQIPKGWTIEAIGNVVSCVGGSTPSTAEPKFWTEGVHSWATPKDLARLDTPILIETERRITNEGLGVISSGLLPAGTVLLSSRAPVGYLAIAEIPLAINQGFIAMKPNERISNYFLLNWCSANMETIENRASGTTFAEISKQNFRPIPIVVPLRDVMAAFSNKVADLYARLTNNVRESKTLASLRDELLPKLLSGELRVS